MNNYDMELITTPPWWPGIIALLVLASLLLAYVITRH
jgi:hypothetical protein